MAKGNGQADRSVRVTGRPRLRSSKETGAAYRGRLAGEDKAIRESLCYLGPDLYDGGERDLSALKLHRPGTLKGSFIQARQWFEVNAWVEVILLLKLAFLNHGLKVEPKVEEDRAALEAWMEAEDGAQAISLQSYIKAASRDRLLYDNVVSLWRPKRKTLPYTLLPETCTYTDVMGIEKLVAELGHKPDDFKLRGRAVLSRDEVKRYTSGSIELSAEFDEEFRVLSRGDKGYGFCKPRMERVFMVCGQAEAMEVGESLLADAGRLVLRHHKIGFEAKMAATALKQGDYLFKELRAKGIEKFLKGRRGLADWITQFDHEISYHWPDPKLYDVEKWQTITQRLMWWGGPVAFMLAAATESPYLPRLLAAEMGAERRELGPYLTHVIQRGFPKIPKVKLVWDESIFLDPRLAWDMVKTLVEQGPLSLRTALEFAGFDAEREAVRKKGEAGAEKDAELLPKFDRNHGERPGRPEEGE